ncbi:hypothetical protein [Bacillus weihaiensis]|uniref:hypothetical protein n=1 Tax=Bacillus weihaiensis TaxID=1547283 RepID=UPI0023570FF7|nr:hypothetical protein [Bacillus weihaiensis]
MKNKWSKIFKFSIIIIGAFLLVCAVVFYPLILDIWIENGSGSMYEFFQKIYDKKLPTIYTILMLSLAIPFLYWVYSKYIQEGDKHEQEIRETSRTLLRKYRELKEFDQRKTLSIVMKKFCLKHDLITAVQIYNYYEVPEKNIMRCKIKHVDGFVKDRQDLNGMIQQNYYISKSIFKEYKKAINKFFEDVNNVRLLLNFILKYVNEIQIKPLNKINNKDAMKYALISDSINVLSNYYPGVNRISISTAKVNKLESILKEQRLGIYRGILSGGFYTFLYDGKGTKEGRQYITNPIIISEQKYITLITLDPELLEDEEDGRNQQLHGFIVEFENMLHDAFEIEYNNDIEGDEYNAV